MEKCPMCKKHDAIIIKRKAKGLYNGKYVDYEETVYFCSFLGEDDPDSYFVPPKVMNENIRKIKEAYKSSYKHLLL